MPYQLRVILLVSVGLLIHSKLEGTLLNEDLCNELSMRKMQLLFLLIPQKTQSDSEKRFNQAKFPGTLGTILITKHAHQ